MRFILIILTCSNVLAVSPIVKDRYISFESFFQSFIKKNDVYLGAVLTEYSAKQQAEGNLGLYYPSMTSSYQISNSFSNTIDDSKAKAYDLSLSGFVPELGMSYSTTLLSSTEYAEPEPSSFSGSTSYSLSFNLLKDFGPRVGSVVFDRADMSVDISKINTLNTLYNQFLSLLTNYASAYASQRNLEITKKSERLNKADLKKSKNLYREGKIPKLSLLSIQAQSQQVRSDVLSQQRSLRSTFTNLYTIASIDTEKNNINFYKELEPLPVKLFDDSIIKSLISTQVDFSKLDNLEYKSAKISLELNKLDILQAENELYPNLSLNYSYNGSSNISRSQSGFFPDDNFGNTISVSLSMPIGFVSQRHNYNSVKASMKSTQISLKQLKRRLLRDWENLKDQYELLSEQVKIGKDLLQAAKDRYQAAVPTATLGPTYQQNIVGFQNEWINSELNLNRILVDYLVMRFQILQFHNHPHLLEVIKGFES